MRILLFIVGTFVILGIVVGTIKIIVKSLRGNLRPLQHNEDSKKTSNTADNFYAKWRSALQTLQHEGFTFTSEEENRTARAQGFTTMEQFTNYFVVLAKQKNIPVIIVPDYELIDNKLGFGFFFPNASDEKLADELRIKLEQRLQNLGFQTTNDGLQLYVTAP